MLCRLHTLEKDIGNFITGVGNDQESKQVLDRYVLKSLRLGLIDHEPQGLSNVSISPSEIPRASNAQDGMHLRDLTDHHQTTSVFRPILSL